MAPSSRRGSSDKRSERPYCAALLRRECEAIARSRPGLNCGGRPLELTDNTPMLPRQSLTRHKWYHRE
jgi:hypothetical protein